MSKRDVQLLLRDILDASNQIFEYTNGFTYEQFIDDRKTIDATVRNFEIIGEASNRIPEDFKLRNPEIDWIGMRGLRNKIAHEYFGLEYENIWQIKETLLPELVDWVKTLTEK